jgi:hypothetical protein
LSEDLVQAAKAAAELEPAVEAFAEATGALEPVRELSGWLADIVRYRRLPHQAKLLQRAAEKIKASGLPAHAVPDKVLRAIIEEGPMEDDELMQERWARLLANAATSDEGHVKIAYPKILGKLEPNEAQLLDRLVEKSPDLNENPPVTFGYDDTYDLVDIPELYNLERLGLLRLVRSIPMISGGTSTSDSTIQGVQVTELGWAFVQACRDPST